MNRASVAFIVCMVAFGCSGGHALPLQVAVEDGAAPWSRKDGSGCANDIVKAAFAAAGADMQLRVVPYARCKDMVVSGAIAACFSMSWDPQFAAAVVFADAPIYRVSARYYRNKLAPQRIASQRDIPPGAVVGIVNGYEYPRGVTELENRGVIFEPANSEIINLQKLARGRIDYALLMLDGLKTEAVLFGAAAVDNVEYAFDGGEAGSYIGFSVRHPEAAAAREKYNEGYKTITANGVLQRIMDDCGQRTD